MRPKVTHPELLEFIGGYSCSVGSCTTWILIARWSICNNLWYSYFSWLYYSGLDRTICDGSSMRPTSSLLWAILSLSAILSLWPMVYGPFYQWPWSIWSKMLAWSIWVLTVLFQISIFGILSDPIFRFEGITLPIFHEFLNGEAKSVRLSLALKAGIEDNEETFENGYVPLQYKTPLNINRAAARIITNFELKSKYRVATRPNGFRNQSILSLKFYNWINFKSSIEDTLSISQFFHDLTIESTVVDFQFKWSPKLQKQYKHFMDKV